MTPQQLISEVDGLFTLPQVYLKIRESIFNHNSSIHDVALVINQDPNISARILKIANSSFFGCATEITSVSRAITIMGLLQLHDLVLATVAVNAFKNISSELIDMKDFWLHSVFCASIARLLARKSHVFDSERLFVCGILHDLGHLVIYSRCPKQAEKILARARQEKLPVASVEKEILGFDYAEVGGELLKSWNLPANLYEAVKTHLSLNNESQYLAEASLIHIANILALQEESSKSGYAAPEMSALALEFTGLNPDNFEAIKLEAKNNMAETINLLFA